MKAETVTAENIHTVRCRSCRVWLCSRPKGYRWELPYPEVRGRVRGWCYCRECYPTAQVAEEHRQRMASQRQPQRRASA